MATERCARQGTYLNIFVRNCEWVRMANLAQLVNAIAPIVTTPALAVVQPIYYPFLLHSSGHLELAVDAHVTGETVPAPAEHLSRSRSASTTSLPSPSSTPRRPSTRSASGSP